MDTQCESAKRDRRYIRNRLLAIAAYAVIGVSMVAVKAISDEMGLEELVGKSWAIVIRVAMLVAICFPLAVFGWRRWGADKTATQSKDSTTN